MNRWTRAVRGHSLSDALFIGIDCGTSSTRAILFDEFGKVIAEGRSDYSVITPHPGWVEQKADWWWEAFQTAIHNLIKVRPSLNNEIKGIAVTHQRMTAVPVDKDIRPLRNAILWNDLRCSEQNKRALEILDGQDIYKRTGYKPGLWTMYKVMWLKDNEPETYSKTYKVLLVQDYLLYKLTGELVTTASTAVTTGCLDITNTQQWASDILEAFDISPSLWIDKILNGGETAGFISKDAAKQTGLKEGLPVITAAGDQPCGALGSGVVKKSMLSINGGTSCTIEMYCEELPLDPDGNYFIEISPTGTYLPENSVPSGGSALMNWLRNSVFSQSGETGYDDWDHFYSLAESVPPGSWGMMLVPYLSGSNAPYWDIDARGVLVGLLLDHKQPHFIRAIIEGLGYEIRRQIALMAKGTGNTISEVRMYGGSAKSDIWNQIFADIIGVKVCTTETVETTALGAAICAAKGLGFYPTFFDAVKNMVKVKRVYYPESDNKMLYDEMYNNVYSKFYDRIHDLINTSSEIMKKFYPY